MSRVTLSDVVGGGVLALVIGLVVAFAVGFVLLTSLSSVGETDGYDAMFVVLITFYLVGGTVLTIAGRKAGLPTLTAWAWVGLIILLTPFALLFIGLAVSGEIISSRLLGALLVETAVLLSWMFFTVTLASYLNDRGFGLPQHRTHGSVPGQFGVFIYRSNQPVIYEGIRELDATDEAPGSLYRQKQ